MKGNRLINKRKFYQVIDFNEAFDFNESINVANSLCTTCRVFNAPENSEYNNISACWICGYQCKKKRFYKKKNILSFILENDDPITSLPAP